MNKHTRPTFPVNCDTGLFTESEVAEINKKAVAQLAAFEAAGMPLPDALPVPDEEVPGNYPLDWPHSRDIQAQQEVRILSLQDGGVELRQATQHTGADDAEAPTIDVTPNNVVRLVFGILDAAGFKSITITTDCDDGEEELKPGSMASDFTWSPPKPPAPVVVKPPTAPKPVVEPEPEEEFDWNDGCTVLTEQRQVAIYTNPNSDMVIRQRDGHYDGGPYREWIDSVVVIQRERMKAFAESVTSFVKSNSTKGSPQ